MTGSTAGTKVTATEAFAVAEALDLKDAVHIGHSTGGGEVVRYVAQYGQPAGRVAKAVLVSAVPPLMLKTETNPEGLPMEVFDGFRAALAANRAQFFRDVPAGPFYGFNRDGAEPQEGVIQNWWRQGMTGGAKAHYDGIKAFSETDQSADLKAITVPDAGSACVHRQIRARDTRCPFAVACRGKGHPLRGDTGRGRCVPAAVSGQGSACWGRDTGARDTGG
nr:MULTISPECIES: alpha/beta hydrolase [Pseudooceanicola]